MSSAWSGASADLPVSVVIPCFQAHATLPRAVASVAGQSAPALEVIVVDDASDDDTAGVVRELQQRYGADWLRLIRLEWNQGPGSARNVGWEAARGECVAFLDADDSWHPRKLEIQRRVMCDHPDVALSAHRHAIDVPAELPSETLQPRLTDISAAALLWRNRFVTPSVMLRRSIANRFRAGQRHMEDHLLWLHIAYAGHRIVVIEMPLAALHKPAFGASGQSAQLSAMECAELGNYILLKNEGRIGVPLLAVLSAWSLAKFLRRLAVVAVRRLSGAVPTG
jgi:teichuronic acid biosynthesis glycosyltransferase TuaG